MTIALRNGRTATILLGWVAGYVDTAGFLGLDGLFTAHVTGNLIVAGAQVAGAGGDAVWVRLAVIPVFVLSVLLTSALAQRHSTLNLLWLETIGLLVFWGVGVTLLPEGRQATNATTLFLVGATGVFAMGVQNTLMREALGTLAPTTVMTGNLTQFVIDIFQLFRLRHADSEARPTQRHDLHARIAKFGSALLGFVVGAAMGAFGLRWVGFWAIALPTAAIAFLALTLQRQKTVLE